MSLRASLVLTGLAMMLGCVGLAFWVWERPGAEASNRIFPDAWRQVRSIRLLRGGIPALEMIEIALDSDGQWRYRVNQARESDLLDPQALEEFKALVTLAQKNPAPEGSDPVDLHSSDQLIVIDGDKREYSIYLAPPDPDGNRRRIALKGAPDQTCLLENDLLRVVNRPVEAFRRMELFDLAGGRQSRMIVLSPGQGGDAQEPVQMERSTDHGWRLTAPVRWPADEGVLESLLQNIIALRARDAVAESADPATFGLGEGAASVLVELVEPDGRLSRQTVYFGMPVGAEGVAPVTAPDGTVYARVEGRSPIFRTPGLLAVALAKGREPAEDRESWVTAYRSRRIRVLDNARKPPPAVAVTAPDGTRMVLRQRIVSVANLAAGMEQGSGQEKTAEAATAAALGEDAPPTETMVEWRAEVRTPDGKVERFPVDEWRRDELLHTLAGMTATAFLPPPANPEVDDAGRRTWRVASLDAADRELVAVRLLEFPGDAPPDPLPDGRVGPPDVSRSPALEAVLEGYAERARISAGVSGFVCRPFFRYREQVLARLDYQAIDWLRVRNGGKQWTYARTSGGAWRQTEPTSRPVVDEQYQLVRTLLRMTRPETAGYVAADAAKGRYGLTPPSAEVVIGTGEGPGKPGAKTLFTMELGASPEQWGFRKATADAYELVAGSAAAEPEVEKPRPGEFPPMYGKLPDRPEVFLMDGGTLAPLFKEYR